MRILVLSPKPPWPPNDGGAVATMRCIEGLAAGWGIHFRTGDEDRKTPSGLRALL